MIDLVRQAIDENGRLPAPACDIADNADLYELGLTSFAAVRIMLALEDAYGVQFPEHMLRRRNFASIAAIVSCLHALERKAA
ncbi:MULTISPECIES: acyl carrier protein [Methylosinus]|uniref:acyl carrier protein n=1 Tax=Methylosinus TaxID=425 RepID=UPI000367243B|nr:acyl carrier protein [Methylosinus sp. LW4]